VCELSHERIEDASKRLSEKALGVFVAVSAHSATLVFPTHVGLAGVIVHAGFPVLQFRRAFDAIGIELAKCSGRAAKGRVATTAAFHSVASAKHFAPAFGFEDQHRRGLIVVFSQIRAICAIWTVVHSNSIPEL